MICPNLNGSESPTYTDHTDRANLDKRLRVLTSHAERARLLAMEQEKEWGCITLFMSKHDLKARLFEAQVKAGVSMLHDYQRRAIDAIRNPRNEREANRAGFTCA